MEKIRELGEEVVRAKYGNLFQMYERDHGRQPVQDADAHLPGRALHHGRTLGGLQPADDHPRTLRMWRGQLL